jgi:hypothetical protein
MYVSDSKLWILWVVIVPLGPLLGWLLQRIWGKLSNDRRRAVLLFFVISLSEGLFTLFTRWSLRGFWPQALNLAVAYTSSICLLAVALKKRKKSAVVVALRSFAVLVFLLLCYGLADVYLITDVPESETNLGNHLVLRRASGGWAGIDWEGVTIVHRPRSFPLVEKRIFSIHIGDEGDCDETSVHVIPNNSAHEILIRCGSGDSIYGRVKMP